MILSETLYDSLTHLQKSSSLFVLSIGKIFLAPRGLITILLFFQIPVSYEIHSIGMGVLFFVILATGLIMMFALISTKDDKIEDFTVIDFGLGPSSDNANVDKISKFSEYEDL